MSIIKEFVNQSVTCAKGFTLRTIKVRFDSEEIEIFIEIKSNNFRPAEKDLQVSVNLYSLKSFAFTIVETFLSGTHQCPYSYFSNSIFHLRQITSSLKRASMQ